ncbi:MAG: FMN-binding negative transcriptional regulator, partial [Acidobacteria bacterium]|nr:FMN-binding negative transcriptional regulator [Acidobacteriota bacterium]
MKRRDLLAGITLSSLQGQSQPPRAQSLYIPKAHLVEDRRFLHDFMDEFSLVELVTAAPEVRITHIPVLLDRGSGGYGKIYGHVSRQNPQSRTLDGEHSAVIVFRGPHSYISPSWYAKPDAVPTWNFAVVHATGRLKPITEKMALHDLLARLIAKFESSRNSGYDFAKLPESYRYRLMEGIIGFEMDVEQLEGKFKLGQERVEADRAGVLKNLKSRKKERLIEELTAS